jgi:hypothetical protein
MAKVQFINAPAQVWGEPIKLDKLFLYAIPKRKPNLMISLAGHGIGDLQFEDAERTPASRYVYENGALVLKQYFTTGLGYNSANATIGIPDGAYTPIEEIAENGANCYDFVLVYNCPPNPCEQFWLEVSDAILSPPRPTSALADYSTQGAPYTQSARLDFIRLRRIYARTGIGIRVVDYADAVYALAFSPQGCAAGCECDPYGDGFFGGGGAAATLFRTGNAFGTGSALTSGIPASHIVTDIYTDSGITLVAYADVFDFETGATGGVRYSVNGTTYSATSGITAGPVYGVTRAGGRYIAVGNNIVHQSFDGINWTVLATLGATVNLSAVTYDADTDTVWIAGSIGSASYLAKINGTSLVVVTTPAGAAEFHSVAVLGKDHLLVGGDGGYVYESVAASSASSSAGWVAASYGSADVRGVGGSRTESWFGVGTTLYTRNPLTDLDFRAVSIAPAPTGDITDIAIARDENGSIRNVRIATTAGEIVALDDCLPSLCSLIDAA